MERFLRRILENKTGQNAELSAELTSSNLGLQAFREFLEDLPLMVYAVEAEPPYSPLFISPAFERFGYPLSEWTQDPQMWLRVIHPDDQKWVFTETASSTETGREVDGVITHRQGVIFDVTAQKRADTERKRAESGLIESESRYRTLFENAND